MAPLAVHIITVQTPDSDRALPAENLKACINEESRNNPDISYPDKANVEALGIEDAVQKSLELAAAYTENGHKTCIIAFGSLSYLRNIKDKIAC